MSENHKNRRKLLATVAICAALLGNGTAMAAEAAPQTVQGTAQSGSISGMVVDADGEPIIGASVMQKGTNTGTATDLDGRFTLKVKRGTPLTISYVGFEPQTVLASNDMQVVLKSSTELLDEVVVVGYGVQKKVNLTGAVANIDVEEAVASRPITDIAKALQGVSPGVNVTTNLGGVGVESTIKLRGSTGSLSASGGTSPLILVDNVEVPSLSMVNPDDIESISVLKDAASSSIYGTRAAWGVILITTKTGKKNEKPRITYSNNFAWSTPTTMPQVAKTYEKLF